MIKMIQTFLVIILAMQLSACLTNGLWSQYPVSKTETSFHLVNQDYVTGFYKVIQKDLPPSFIVVGHNNAYLIQEDSGKINEFLLINAKNTKLEIVTSSQTGLVLTIKPEQQKNYDFDATLEFKITANEPTQQQNEVLKEKAKNMKANFIEKENSSYLTARIPIKGQIAMLNDEIKAQSRQDMSKAYKVRIGYYSSKKSLRLGQLLENIIQTPITLAADAILFPVAMIGITLDATSH